MVASVCLGFFLIALIYDSPAFAFYDIKVIAAPGIPAPAGIQCIGGDTHLGISFPFYPGKVYADGIECGGPAIFDEQRNGSWDTKRVFAQVFEA